jgi:hypothetical protein
MAGLLGDQSDNSGNSGGFLQGLLSLFKPTDYSAEYTGSLAKDPATGQMDPAVQHAFAMRALAGASNAFAEGGMPVPYKGGIPLLSTIGKAGAAATLGPDSLIDAREKAAQTTLALAQAGNAQAEALVNKAILQGLGQRPGAGGQSGPGGGTGTDGKPKTGPAALLAQQGNPPIGAGTGGGENREIATNNFAGMRMPGVPAAGGPITNPKGWQVFDTPEAGVQAISNQLDRYAAGKTTGTPLTTLNGIINTWAPPSENDTGALVKRAATIMGVDPDAPLNLADPAVKAKLVEAMIRNEQGGNLHPKAAQGIAGVFGNVWSPYGGKEQTASAAPVPPPDSPAPAVPAGAGQVGTAPAPTAGVPPAAPPPNGALPLGAEGNPGPVSLLGRQPEPTIAAAPPAPGGGIPGPGAGGATPVAMGGAPPPMQPMPGRFGGMGPMRAGPPSLLQQVSDTGGGAGPTPAEARAAVMGQEGGGVRSLLNPQQAPAPPAAAPAPAVPSGAAPAPAAPQAAPATPPPPASLPPPPVPPTPPAPPQLPPTLDHHVSNEEIEWAQKMSALMSLARRTVPPDIAAIATLPTDLAKESQKQALDNLYKQQQAAYQAQLNDYNKAREQQRQFGYAGPTAGATKAAEQPFTLEQQANKAMWDVYVAQNKPRDPQRAGTFSFNPVTGNYTLNRELVEADGTTHQHLTTVDQQGRQLSDYDAGAIKASPGAVKTQEGLAGANVKDFETVQNEARAAAGALTQATFMRQEAPNFHAGPGSHEINFMNKALVSLGMGSDDAAKSAASYESFIKDAGALARSQAQAISQRVGVQELQAVAGTMPGADNTQRGLDRTLAQIQGLSDYRLIKQQAMTGYMAHPDHAGSNAGFEADFNKNISPYTYMYMRMSDPDRADIRNQLSSTPGGRADLQRLQGQINYIQSKNLLPVQ